MLKNHICTDHAPVEKQMDINMVQSVYFYALNTLLLRNRYRVTTTLVLKQLSLVEFDFSCRHVGILYIHWDKPLIGLRPLFVPPPPPPHLDILVFIISICCTVCILLCTIYFAVVTCSIFVPCLFTCLYCCIFFIKCGNKFQFQFQLEFNLIKDLPCCLRCRSGRLRSCSDRLLSFFTGCWDTGCVGRAVFSRRRRSWLRFWPCHPLCWGNKVNTWWRLISPEKIKE